MFVSEFYDPCKDKKFFKSLQEKSGNYVFSEQLRIFLDTIDSFEVSEAAVSLITDLLNKNLERIQFDFIWERESFVADSVKKVTNLLEWLNSSYDKKIHGSCVCSYAGYEQSVSLIAEKDGVPCAVLVSVGRNQFSPNGRSVSTKSENNLAGLVVKGALNPEYPGIGVATVYLSSDKDKVGNIGDGFIINNTKSSNVYVFDFKDVDVDSKISLVTAQNITSDCFACKYQSLCRQKNKKVRAVEPSVKEVKPYHIPEFTPSQMKVVTHKDGPLLVVAPPGSGKTATLVGRMKWLMEQGIDPAFILAISFTKSAAREIKERISAYCEGEPPTCSTINALALNILTQNEKIVGKVKTLTKREDLCIIDEILSVLDPLPDFNYGNKYGDRGLLMTARRRLAKYKESNFDKEDFYNVMKGEVSDAFFDFAEIYFSRIKEGGYITYDEQVEMACKFLEDYPAAADDYQRLWKYIMVDEYQDVNESQANLIYQLAGHGNLVVVGDDDQSIYGFRGAKPQVMVDFYKDFHAQKIELMENFRSTKAIFNASKEVVKVNARIEKKGEAVRDGGVAPIMRIGSSVEDVQRAINDAIKEGYEYKDIAVLSGTNKFLEDLDMSLDCPTRLQKALVIDTDIFNCIYFGLKVRREPENREAAWRLEQVVGSGQELLDQILNIEDVSALISGVADFVSAPTEEVEAMSELVEENQVDSVASMYGVMEYMVNFEDDTRVDVVSNRANEVLLITSHESKGLEFPVVILIDDKKARNTDEERRVLYVSMTRAKDRLYILKKGA